MIAARGLTKRFGDTLAVDDVSFELAPGRVCAILGPDGAGKSTTLRMLLGLVHPSSGSSEILGRPFRELDDPPRRVGALLVSGAHPGRTARDHLRVCAALAGRGAERVDRLLAAVGLQEDADRRAGGLSADMRQRLGIAAALVGDPEVLVLDEPANGLGREGVRWLGDLLRRLAKEGRTVLLSSHSLRDAAQSAEQILVMEGGALVAESSVDELARRAGSDVVIRSPGAEVLAERLERSGIATERISSEEVRARDAPASAVTDLAVANGLPVWEVRSEAQSLDQALSELTADSPGRQREAGGALNGGPPPSPEREVKPAAERAIERDLSGQPKPSDARVVIVASPAHGMGCTTVSVLIGDVLAEQLGLRSLVVALSLDRERMALPAPEEQRSKLRLEDLMRDLQGFDDAARISPYVSVARSGLHTLTGPREAQALEELAPERLDALLEFAARFYDVIVLDVGGLEESALSAAIARTDQVVLLGSFEGGAELAAPSPVVDAIERMRSEPATLVLNRVDPETAAEVTTGGGSTTHTVLPDDHELIRALDSGDFRLSDARPDTRIAIKRLGLLVARRLS